MEPVETGNIHNSDTDSNNTSVVAIAILVVLLVVLVICVILLTIFVFKLKMQLQAISNDKRYNSSYTCVAVTCIAIYVQCSTAFQCSRSHI